MIKRIVLSTILTSVIGSLIYVFHQYILDLKKITLIFSLIEAYVFFYGCFIAVILLLEFVNKLNNFNVGYIYLFTFGLKLIVFVAAYKDLLLSDELMPFSIRISLLTPMIVYIIFEALYTIKLVSSAGKYNQGNQEE